MKFMLTTTLASLLLFGGAVLAQQDCTFLEPDPPMLYPLDEFSKIYFQGTVMPTITRVASETPMIKVTRFFAAPPQFTIMDVEDERRLVLQSEVCITSSETPAPSPSASASSTLNAVATAASVFLGMHLTGSSPFVAAGAGFLTGLGSSLPAAMALDACDGYMEIEIHGPVPTVNATVTLLQEELAAAEAKIAELEAQLAAPETPECDGDGSAEIDEVAPSSIFDPPTADEMDKIATVLSTYDFTDAGAPGTVLTPAPLAGPDRTAIDELFGGMSLATTMLTSPSAIWGGIQTTYISRIDVLNPTKAAATAYLFGEGPKPERYAQANVAFGSIATPKFVEYKVGPLDGPVEEMTVEMLSEQLWGSRPREGNEMRALKAMVDSILNEEDFLTLTSESFAGKTHGNGLNNHEPAPPGLVGSDRFTQITILFTVEGTWRGKDLNAVPLSFTINNTDVDPSMWTADEFYYNTQGPFTRDELIDSYMSDGLEKIVIPASHYDVIQKSSFPQRRPEYPERNFATLPGPQMYMPAGPRYTVSGRTVNWMGWEFHAGYNFRAGPNFKNIMFKDERIAYEVSMNDISLIYAANDPVGGNVNFMDATFGNGEYRELMRGVDCPDYATYLTNFWWAAPGGSQTALRSTCVFESNSGDTLWRRGGSFVSGLPNTVLNVRFVMPNGNYDYIVTYKFKLDGELRVEIGSSGYIQTHFMPPDRGSSDSMAYRVHDYAGGSFHDHTFGFKVDMDVAGETNSFETLRYKSGPTLEALNAGREADALLTEKPPYLLFDTMRYVEYTPIENENDALLNVDPQNPTSWFFGDSTKKNKWGNTRAYHLKLDSNPSSQIPEDSHVLPAFNFARQMLGVTVYKENEQTLTGFYDLNRLDDPQGDFYNYVDGESIVQEDLVAWVTMTALHLPTSENMPMTNNILHGFTIGPHNFFDENPAMDLPHYLRMHPTEAAGDTRMEDLPSVGTCTPTEFDSLTHTFAGV